MNRAALVSFLNQYTTLYDEEKPFIEMFLKLLSSENCYHRNHLPGHITGSAWIINQQKDQVLLVHHAKLNRWMQPGGHADGDENILRVALKEAEEETGLKNLVILNETAFDLDIHLIPERKDFPRHLHYDVRFLLQADNREPIIVSEESHDVKWIPLNQLEYYNKDRSVLRMRDKLFGTN